MKTSIKIVIVIIVLLVVGFIIGSIWAFQNQVSTTRHHEFCQSWLDRINSEKAQVASQLFPSDTIIAQMNSGIDQYNQECTR